MFQFQFQSKEYRSENLPHLQFTANNTQVSVVFDNITTSFEKSRFGMELILVTSDKTSAQMNLTKDRTLDDEHTPGVFEVLRKIKITSLKFNNVIFQLFCLVLS